MIGLWPLGLVIGAIALTYLNPGRLKGRGLAISSVVLSLLWAVATCSFVVYTGSHADPQPTPTTAVLHVGDCLADLRQGRVSADDLKVVPCSQPHHGEVYAVFRHGDSRDPGESRGPAECGDLLAEYSASAFDDNAISVYHYSPTIANVSENRIAACIAVDEDHTRTGSIHG